MNKILYIAAALSLFAACNRIEIEDKTTNSSDGTRFEEGQEVTLTIGASGATKVNGILNADNDVNFKWEAGDAIKVTVNGTSSQFVVSELIDGGARAKFKGFMPAGGSTFDVQFPCDTPDLTTQEYVENGVPHNMMLATATGCTVDAPFALDPQNAALKLNFYGYDRKVTSIAVTNNTADPNETYTLNCTTPVKVGVTEANATPFLMVVPTGTYSFTVQVTADEVIPNVDNNTIYEDGGYSGSGVVVTTGTFKTTSAKVFTSANIKDMPAQCITQIWSPVNCGFHTTDYPYGKMYQWGRKYGQGYKDSSYEDADYPGKVGGAQFWISLESPKTTHPDGLEYNGEFYYPHDYWYSGPDAVNLWDSNSEYDPCPDGWNIPTSAEYNKLLGLNSSSGSGWDSERKGYWLNGTTSPAVGSGIFFPAAGCLNPFADAIRSIGSFDRGITGSYWTSKTGDSNPDYARYLTFLVDNDGVEHVGIVANGRSYGFSIRCIHE